jgi:hypothetical protein
MITKLVAFAGLWLLISPALADDGEMEKCQAKIKCRQGSSAASGYIKPPTGSHPPSNLGRPAAPLSNAEKRPGR